MFKLTKYSVSNNIYAVYPDMIVAISLRYR